MKLEPSGGFTQAGKKLMIGVRIEGPGSSWVKFGVMELHIDDVSEQSVMEVWHWLTQPGTQAPIPEDSPLFDLS